MNSFRRRAGLIGLLLLLSAIGVAASASSAFAANCGTRTLTQPFARFGDSNSYFLAPGGSFENGASGWSLSGAYVASGNESYYLVSSTDRSSLRIDNNATSPGFCITQDDPLVRFVARSVKTGSGGNYSSLNVSAVITSKAGSVKAYFLGQISAPSGANWFVSPQLHWGSPFDAFLFPDGTASIKLQFTVQGSGGAWYIDDVFVDPYSGR